MGEMGSTGTEGPPFLAGAVESRAARPVVHGCLVPCLESWGLLLVSLEAGPE